MRHSKRLTITNHRTTVMICCDELYVTYVNVASLCLSKHALLLSPFHLKEAPYGFSFTYVNCQHHYLEFGATLK